MPIRIRKVWLATYLAGLATLAVAQETQNLDAWYAYPFSVGAAYESVTPFAAYRSAFDLYDLSAKARLPLPGRPVLQPSLQVGLLQFSPRSTDQTWAHRDLYGLLGADWSLRFSKTFELGAGFAGGASLSLFDQLLPGAGTVATPNLYFLASAKLALVPAFNFALEFTPTLGYIQSLGPLSDFDGLVLGLGLSAHVRLGEDPDAPKAALRSIHFGQAEPTSVFPAMQSWYAKNPITKLTITNTESFPVSNVEVSFLQKGYMDSPTLCASFPELRAGESREVGILASFNGEVFRNEGVTPLSGEIVATYSGRGRSGEQRTTLSYDLQDKSAIVWDDDRKAAAFVTPADSAVGNYVSYVRQIAKETVVPGYSDNVQLAIQLFNALAELGILYQVDPTSPYTATKGARTTVDSVSLPRTTLKRTTGDCDDLTVLFASLLESAGVQTALITVPGHIYVAFGTKTAGRLFADINPDRTMTINVEDELWVPVEITMIGLSSFGEAWHKAIEEWRAAEATPELRGFYLVKKAQELYRPVGLRETDLGLQYGHKEPVVAAVRTDVAKLVNAIVETATSQARISGAKEDWNRLGIKLARLGQADKAVSAFNQAAKLDPNYVSPKMNLGNMYFLSKTWDKALGEYLRLDKALPTTSPIAASLRLNISKCYNAMGEYKKAGEFLASAAALDPALGTKYAYLAQSADPSGGRAAQAESPADEIIFGE